MDYVLRTEEKFLYIVDYEGGITWIPIFNLNQRVIDFNSHKRSNKIEGTDVSRTFYIIR